MCYSLTAPPTFFRQISPSDRARRLPHRRSYSDLIPIGIDESSPDPPLVLPKPQVHPWTTKRESEWAYPNLPPGSYRQHDPASQSTLGRPPDTLDVTSNDRRDAQKPEMIQHTHHHYWIRSSSAPVHTTQRPNQPLRRYSNETPIPVTEAESDPLISQFPPWIHTEQRAAHRTPAESSRHRYIIGTPPKLEEPHVKILSDGFSRRRRDWREEHTHIHIYVPSSPRGLERDAAQCNPAQTPILEEHGNNEGERSISSPSTQIPKDRSANDMRKRQSKALLSTGRARRHRRSFQD